MRLCSSTALSRWPRDVRGNKYLDLALREVVGVSKSWSPRSCQQALLAKGANPNARFGGLSIIDFAIIYTGHESPIVQLLLDHGAVPTTKVDHGDTRG